MTIPNIVATSTIYGKTDVLNVSTNATAITTNASASNSVYKINAVIIANIDGVNAADVTVDLYRSSTAYKILNTVSVVADSTLIALNKEFPIYLEEGDALRITASANSALTAVCSYEVIS